GDTASRPYAALECGKGAAPLAKFDRFRPRLAGERSSDSLAHRHRLRAVVGDAKRGEQIREPHHAQSNLSRSAGCGTDLLRRVARRVNQVVEEHHRVMDRLPESIPLEIRRSRESREIDRTQGARLVREQRLLAARIGRLDSAQRGSRVVTLYFVQKKQAGISACMGGFYNAFEEAVRADESGHVSGARIAQRKVRPLVQRIEELIGKSDR